VVEVEVDLHHNPTGKDLSGILHRARQARAIARELTRRRAWRPTPGTRPTARSPTEPGPRGDPADAGSPGWEGSPGTREGDGGFHSPRPAAPAHAPPPPAPGREG
jgi:hypothetical protein